MQIVQAPANVLSEKARLIKKIDKDVVKLINSMKQTLVNAKDPEGVGLAAPQIGESLQIFIIKPTLKSTVQVYINPKVTINSDIPKQTIKKEKDKKDDVQLEGCLSLKDIWGTVNRANKIHVKYMDEKGQTHEKDINGFLATIIQHEYDHLQGILFPRRVLEQEGQLYKSSKNDKGDDEFEEINL